MSGVDAEGEKSQEEIARATSMQKGLSDGIVIANRILVISLSLALTLGAGWWIGGAVGSALAGMLVGLVLGMVAAGYQLMQLVKWLNRRTEEKKILRANAKSGSQDSVRNSNDRSRATTDPGLPGENDVEEPDPWVTRWEKKWADDNGDEDSEGGND